MPLSRFFRGTFRTQTQSVAAKAPPSSARRSAGQIIPADGEVVEGADLALDRPPKRQV
jgi:hypothetical protein